MCLSERRKEIFFRSEKEMNERTRKTRENARKRKWKLPWSFSGLIQDTVPKQDDWGNQCGAQVEYNRSRPPDGPAFTPHCRWAPRSALDAHSFRFGGGAEVQLETVPPGLLPRIPEYFICTRCGKVFWEGTHFDRALAQFHDILNISDEDTTARKHWVSRRLRAGEKNHRNYIKYQEVESSSPRTTVYGFNTFLRFLRSNRTLFLFQRNLNVNPSDGNAAHWRGKDVVCPTWNAFVVAFSVCDNSL